MGNAKKNPKKNNGRFGYLPIPIKCGISIRYVSGHMTNLLV